MGGRKNHSWRPGKSHQDIGAPRRRTPPDSDTDMFGSPSIWCRKKKSHHHSEAKGRRSGKGVGVDEQPRQKHRILYSPFQRLFGTNSKHRHRKNTTPSREHRAAPRFGLGHSTSPPPPPPPPLKQSSPYTPNKYLHGQSGWQATPPRSFRRTLYRTPTSPTRTSPGFSASSTPSTTFSTPRPPSNPLNPTCESCFKMHHLNATLRQSLLAHTRDMYTMLQNWADDVGCGDGTGFVHADPMEWQPEKAAVVIEKERRPSEMCRVLMKMGSVEDWVGFMRGLEEKEGGGGGQKMEGVKAGGDGEDMRDGEGDSGLGGDYCLRYRRMAVDRGGGQG